MSRASSLSECSRIKQGSYLRQGNEYESDPTLEMRVGFNGAPSIYYPTIRRQPRTEEGVS